MRRGTAKAQRRSLKKGQALIWEDELDRDFYLLEKGVLDVTIRGRKIDTIAAGRSHEFVGEVAALLHEPRIATVTAATDCVFMCIPIEFIESVFERKPSLGVELARFLCRKLKGSSHAHAEYQEHRDNAVSLTGSTADSLRNYMKGMFALMEGAGNSPSGTTCSRACSYFRETNPWGIQHGDDNLVLKGDNPST